MKQFILMIFLICGISAFASDEPSELMKQRVQQKVAQLNDNISFMADKSKGTSTRNYYHILKTESPTRELRWKQHLYTGQSHPGN